MRAIASHCGSNCYHEDFICCGRKMTPTGFEFSNGWECQVCGHREFDVVSFKMGGNYEEYLRMSDNARVERHRAEGKNEF